MLKVELLSDSAVEPVNVAELRAHLRVSDNLEDAVMAAMLTAARKSVEQILRRALISQTWKLYLDDFPDNDRIKLPFPPLASVTNVKYYNQDAALTTLSTAYYQVDSKKTPGEVVLKGDASWPLVELDKVNAVEVEFVAGYGSTPSSVPNPIRIAILHLASHWFENREPFSTTNVYNVPSMFDAILQPYRFLTLR